MRSTDYAGVIRQYYYSQPEPLISASDIIGITS